MTGAGGHRPAEPARRRSATPRPVHVALLAVLSLLAIGSGCSPDHDRSEGASTLTVAAYVAPWDRRGDRALERPPAQLRELSPVWYEPTASGGVILSSDGARVAANETMARLRGRHVRLVPSVSNFRRGMWDGALVATILHDEGRRSQHIDALVDVARRPGISGVDLDYESLRAEDRDEYTAFVHVLARALHRVDRTLTVTVHAKTTEPGTTPGGQAQDWRQLGAAADEVRIMAYDHAWQGSPPGPIAPRPWVEDVLRFAVDQIPPAKIFLGLPAYGYDWPEGGSGRNLAWADAMTIARAEAIDQHWDERRSSPWLTYTDNRGTRHTVWYENARSLAAKLHLVRQYSIGGVVIWKLGGEDPAIWQALSDLG